MLKKYILNKILPLIYKQYLKIRLKTQPLNISHKDNCLLITPHSDDESISMGGTLYKFKKNFKVILLTDGRLGLKHLNKEEAIKIRLNEFNCAMDYCGVNKREILYIEDQRVYLNFETFSKIDISNYDKIFIPNFLDHHLDHKSVSINLCKMIKNKTKYKKNLKIIMYEVWATLALPNRFVDITDVIDNKIEMLKKYKSQMEITDYLSYALGLNTYRAIIPKTKYAEAFLELDINSFVSLIDSIYPQFKNEIEGKVS